MNFLGKSNPQSNGQTVFLHPRQGLHLELTLPVDCEWHVDMHGNFLALESSCIKDGCKHLYYQQLFDLKEWSKHSSVQIGELNLRFQGNPPKGFPPEIFTNKTIAIVLQGKADAQKDILTIINPVCVETKMAAHQTLEVVIFDESSAGDYEALMDEILLPDAKDQEISLKEVRREKTVHRLEYGEYRDMDGQVGLVNRHTSSLKPNPRIDEKSPLRPKKQKPSMFYHAQHFFYQIDDRSVKNVQRMPNGVHHAATLTYYQDNVHPSPEFQLNVMVGVKGANKPKLRRLRASSLRSSGSSWNPFSDLEIGRKVLAKEHVCEKKLLINPNDRDAIEWASGDENATIIEIAPPHYFDPSIPKDLEWSFEAEPVWLFKDRHMPEIRLDIRKLEHRFTQGVVSQRVLVTPRGNLPRHNKISCLGLLKISCMKLLRCVPFYFTTVTPLNGSNKNTSSKTAHKPLPPERIRITVKEIQDNTLVTPDIKVCLFHKIKLEEDNSTKKAKK